MSAAVPPTATADATGLGTGTTRCAEQPPASTRVVIMVANSEPPSERFPTINTLPIRPPNSMWLDRTLDDRRPTRGQLKPRSSCLSAMSTLSADAMINELSGSGMRSWICRT